MVTYTAPYKENTRQEYDRKRTSFTAVVYDHRISAYFIVYDGGS